MADTKISQLTQLAEAPAGGDEFPIVDVSASATKYITVTHLFTSPGFTTAANPVSSDGAALGTTALMWSDLFLASGAVVNFNNGDVTITHSANVLSFAGGTYNFDGAVGPSTNDAAALGSATVSWADLFLASGGVINFNNGNITLTHAAGQITMAGGTLILPNAGLQMGSSVPFSDSAGTLTLQNVDALDATTEATIEAAIDTLANLTSIQGQTVSFSAPLTIPADPNADRMLFWDDSAGATAWLAPGNGLTITTTTIAVDSASDTVDGIVELATAAETTTGTDATRAVTPDGLAGSDYGKRVVGILVVAPGTNTATGDGKAFFRVPSVMNGWNLVGVAMSVYTAGTTNTTDVQIRNITQAADMLTTKITIDSTEVDSSTAATAAVIDTANDDVATGDRIAIDVDAVSTTPAQGLYVELIFQLP